MKKKDHMEQDMERRFWPTTEIRVGTGDEEKKLIGYAAVFNSLSQDLWGFREQITPGAFEKTIKKEDVRALWNHDPNFVLGRTKSKTLILEEDDRGLKVEITPPDTQWANDLMASIARKDVSQMSFGFNVITDSWEIKNGVNMRTLEEVRLIDVSPVTFPAYTATKIQARSLMKKVGIDIEGIDRVLVRIEHGLEVSQEDEAVLRAAIDKFTSLLPPVATNGEEENTGKPSLSVGLLRKKLDNKLKLIIGDLK